MAGNGNNNVVARRVTDDLVAMSGETTVPGYMKFLINQKIAETHSFVNRMRDELQGVRGCITQMNALVAEFRAMDYGPDVHNGLLTAKDLRRDEESKRMSLNQVIEEALEKIEYLETAIGIFDGEDNED